MLNNPHTPRKHNGNHGNNDHESLPDVGFVGRGGGEQPYGLQKQQQSRGRDLISRIRNGSYSDEDGDDHRLAN